MPSVAASSGDGNGCGVLAASAISLEGISREQRRVKWAGLGVLPGREKRSQ